MATDRLSYPVNKPLGGLIFVLFWVIAIVAWSLVGLSSDHATRGFIADVGLVFAFTGLAAPFLTLRQLRFALIAAALGIILFAVFGFTGLTVFVYALRIAAIFLGVMAPVYKLVGGLRVLP